MKLFLIRHAESQGNVELRLQGRKEFPLTERGVWQAERLSERLLPHRPAAIYTSPIQRAFRTAGPIALKAGLEPLPEPRLQEYDFGDQLSGLTWQEIRQRQPEIVQALTMNDSTFPRYPGEEGRGAFKERVTAALDAIAERHASDSAVAVVTHAGPIAVFVLGLLGRNYSRPIPLSIDNASVTTVEFHSGGSGWQPPAQLTALNDTCHLRVPVGAQQPGTGGGRLAAPGNASERRP